MLKMENTILTVVDVQGKLASLMYNRDEFYAGMVKIIMGAKILELPVIWNEQLPEKLGPTVPPVAKALEGYKPLIKKTFSCCGNPDFMAALKKTGRRQILLAGMETHVCVYQSALDLLAEGYEVYLVADAVSSRTMANYEIAIEAMRDAGAKIISIELALTSLLRVAEGDKFREIIKLIK